MNDPKLKQQIAEKIKNSSNILVTVSDSPSVDELAAALGLTLLLNGMEKHATAIFSGEVPAAINFLDPDKTFENTTDSLRDFIIALDKEKADHLRYKLEGDLVKIYITPYRNTITSDDLEFSQGDYNVELVIALGVENRDHLDRALEGHGKILHDATVVTLTAGEQVSNLGNIDWHDSNASSLSEMAASIYTALKVDKKLLSKATATAWLTGIVAATERFSNPRTTSKVMSLASELMAAGADQQLIAAKLDESALSVLDTSSDSEEAESVKTDDTDVENTELKIDSDKADASKDDGSRGSLQISHEKQGDVDEVAHATAEESLAASERAAQRALEKHEERIAEQQPEIIKKPTPPTPAGAVEYKSTPIDGLAAEPTGEKGSNNVILSHGPIAGSAPAFNAPLNGAKSIEAPLADPFAFDSKPESTAPTVPVRDITPPSESQMTAPTLAELDAANRDSAPHDEARAAVEAALAASLAPASAPVAPPPSAPVFDSAPIVQPIAPPTDNFEIPLPPPPPMPDFSAGLPPLPPSSQPAILGDILTEEQNPVPMPSPAPSTPPQPPVSADPGQFRIPGQ